MAMDGTETDSICHVKASDLYPKRELLCDECELVVPFTPLCGEAVEYLGRDVDVVIALSNYRFYLQLKDTYYNIPLGLIDFLEVKDIFFLHIFCKDAQSFRHTGNGAVIARCSQPEVGWLGWRSSEDEDLLKAIADACDFDRGHLQSENGESILDLTNSILAKDDIFVDLGRKKVLIMDARSYTTAVANRARGGGCECPEYYPGCEIQFMNLANIHSIRKSFQAVRQLCSSVADKPNWFSLLEGTRWLQHMAGLLRAALAVVSAVEQEGRPVLVHCSDGWDRTPQIVALAKLLLDPYYRTIEGFRILCENEWLDFGHKFADRCGHMIGCADPNERCPVFLQWLDCVHQLLLQFPCAFEFSHSYLVLWPSCNVRNLVLWCEVYLGSVESTVNSVISSSLTTNETPKVDDVPGVPLSAPSLCKTRSCVNLLAAAEHSSGQQRRSSDPNVTRELKLDALSLTDENIPLDNLEKHHTELTDPVCLKSGVISLEMFETVLGNNELPRERLINNLLNDSNDKNEDTTDSRSETTMFSNEVQDNTIISNPLSSEASSSSVDSSTDTLVAGEVNGFGKWIKINDSEADKKGNTCVFEKPPAFGNGVGTLDYSDSNLTSIPSNFSTSDICRVCANSRRCLADKDGSTSSSTSGKTSRYSTPPLYSQTPSSRYPATPNDERTLAPRLIHAGSRLDDVDGLAPLQNDVQVRVQQIIADHRESRPESGCSEDQPSGESVRSDVSWEAVEETGASPTLWVPDHAVNRCMGCNIEFSWLGRRKHHCRNCGKIFCADCSDNTVPLPNEQLYDPVRVCANCYSMLHNSSTLLKRHRAIPFSSIEYSGSLNFFNDFTDYGSITMKDEGAATADIALVDNCKPSNTLVSDTEGKPPIPVISAAST
uniref:Lateral signaling target protein 2 homolog n=1 Tax=Timema shepardi TaxID=629360 RepID=A0A7R9AY88_TIMSH|nr:unnamed protein product [Timema shepardi]